MSSLTLRSWIVYKNPRDHTKTTCRSETRRESGSPAPAHRVYDHLHSWLDEIEINLNNVIVFKWGYNWSCLACNTQTYWASVFLPVYSAQGSVSLNTVYWQKHSPSIEQQGAARESRSTQFSRSSSRWSEKRTKIMPVLQARRLKEHVVYIVTQNCLLHISSSPHSHPKPHWGCFSIAWLGCFESQFSPYVTRLEQVFRFLGRWNKIVCSLSRDLVGWKLTYGLQLLLGRSTSLCQFSSGCHSRPCVWDKLSCVADILVLRKCLIIKGADG